MQRIAYIVLLALLALPAYAPSSSASSAQTCPTQPTADAGGPETRSPDDPGYIGPPEWIDPVASAELHHADVPVAGSLTDFDIEITIGNAGVVAGGGISVGIHHGAEWTTQIHQSTGKNLVTVENSGPAELDLERHGSVPAGMFTDTKQGLFSDSIFHKLFIARVPNCGLAPGDRVVYSFGANSERIEVPKSSTVHDQEFRVTVDDDGDGVFDALATSPTMRIVHAPVAHLAAVMPSQVALGEDVDIVVRAEDEFLNVATSYAGTVSLHDEHGVLLASGVDIADGIGTAQVALSTPGHHRVRITGDDDELEGRSNPVRASESLPESRLYWGDIHGHTGVSDGLGRNADEYFGFGRDVAALDFIALTDHGHHDWPANIAAVQAYHDPGRYVTLLAQEAGAGPDHMNLYYRRDDTAHLSGWYDVYAEFMDAVYSQYNQTSNEVITAPHHFGYDRGTRGDPLYPFGLWDDRIARFVEVYSAHGTSEFEGNPRPLSRESPDEMKYLQGALAAGLRFGVIGASDNHDSKPGRSVWGHYPGGLAAVWTSELTRDAVWDALWDYRTYGTSADRIYVDVDVDGRGVGESFETTEASVDVAAYVIGKTDDLDVTVVHDNQDVSTTSTATGLLELTEPIALDLGHNVVYLRVEQDNGERAWSTPVWITRHEPETRPRPLGPSAVPCATCRSR